MEISHVTVKGRDKQSTTDETKQKMQIQVVKVIAAQSAGNGQKAEIRELEEQIGREEQIIGELQEKLNRKREEAQTVRQELDDARRTADSLRDETAAAEREMEQSRHRHETNLQRLGQLKKLEHASDEEIVRRMGAVRERYEKLIRRHETAQADLEMDMAQLGEMKVSEFVDEGKVKALEEKYAEISQRMQVLQQELRSLCLGAGQEGDKRTDHLNINE